MEFLIELIMELVFEGTLDQSTNRKVPNWIRYPLIVLVGLFFTAVVGIILLVGLVVLREYWFVGLPLIALAIGFALLTVRKFRRVYIQKRDHWN